MIKRISKYFFILLFYSSLFLNMAAANSSKRNDINNNPFKLQINVSSLRLSINYISTSSSLAFHNVNEKVSSADIKFTLRKRKLQNRLKLLVDIILGHQIFDNFNSYLQKHSISKLLDKSNHEVFLI